MMFIKFIGITQELSALIEGKRRNPDQAEHEILLEALRAPLPPIPELTEPLTRPPGGGRATEKTYDLGQGVRAYVGENLLLFLDEQSKKSRKWHGLAVVQEDGIYVDGVNAPKSRGSEITPAMHIFQERLGRRNADGELISLNAYRQWHVLRGDKLLRLVDLKDPAKSRKRGQKMTSEQAEQILAQVGLTPNTTTKMAG